MPNTKPFAYFGTPYVGRDTLAYLFEQGFVPSVVITSPPALRGRGLVLTPSETDVWAREHGIPVLTPEKLAEAAIEEIRAYGCAYGIVVAYGKILPTALIESFPLGVLNIHYSLLPKYRGASPVETALRNGETVTGVSIQKMVRELDAGDVVVAKEVAIEPTETVRELRPRLVTVGAELLVSVLPEFERGAVVPTPQDHAAATFAKKISKEEGELQIPGSDADNWRAYRAYAEGPGTYFYMERAGQRIRVKIVSAVYENDRFVIKRVIPEGKKEMAFEDLAR